MIFLKENAIYVFFVLAALVGVALYLYVVHNENLPKKRGTGLTSVFSRRDYRSYKADSEKALNNTPVSFKPNYSSEPSINALYNRTLLAGTKLMRPGTFSVAKVGDI